MVAGVLQVGFSFLENNNRITWTGHTLFVRASPGGCWEHFHVLAVRNAAATNVPVRGSVWTCSHSSWGRTGGGAAGSSGDSVCLGGVSSFPTWFITAARVAAVSHRTMVLVSLMAGDVSRFFLSLFQIKKKIYI